MQVRNRNIPKRETEALIKDMWKCKHAHDKKNALKGKPPEDIHEYIYMSRCSKALTAGAVSRDSGAGTCSRSTATSRT